MKTRLTAGIAALAFSLHAHAFDLEGALKGALEKGAASQADELVLAMNRAAEAAVPEAKTLRLKSVREMTLEDRRNF